MKVMSLFSGIGGFDLAAQRCGHDVICACEIDKYAKTVYTRHFPRVAMFRDATKINLKELPDFDILCAGFLCQAFSISGKKRGFNDTRGTLFFEITKIVREKKPSYLLLENVKGLLSHDQGQTFRCILAALDEVGYDVQWQIINSKYFVPQNRERIYIIGYNRKKCKPKILSFGKMGGDLRTKSDPKVKYFINSVHALYRVFEADGISSTLGASGFIRTPKIALAKSTNNDKKVRKLMPLECERLQGFPDGWTVGISDSQRYKCIGNAVTVPVVEFILREMVDY